MDLLTSSYADVAESSGGIEYNEYLISDVTHQSLIGVADVSHCLLAVSVTPLLSNEQEITGKTSNTVSLSSSNDKDMSSPISCLSEDITSSDSEIGQAMKGHSSRDVEDVKKSTDYSSDSSSGSSPGSQASGMKPVKRCEPIARDRLSPSLRTKVNVKRSRSRSPSSRAAHRKHSRDRHHHSRLRSRDRHSRSSMSERRKQDRHRSRSKTRSKRRSSRGDRMRHSSPHGRRTHRHRRASSHGKHRRHRSPGRKHRQSSRSRSSRKRSRSSDRRRSSRKRSRSSDRHRSSQKAESRSRSTAPDSRSSVAAHASSNDKEDAGTTTKRPYYRFGRVGGTQPTFKDIMLQQMVEACAKNPSDISVMFPTSGVVLQSAGSGVVGAFASMTTAAMVLQFKKQMQQAKTPQEVVQLETQKLLRLQHRTREQVEQEKDVSVPAFYNESMVNLRHEADKIKKRNQIAAGLKKSTAEREDTRHKDFQTKLVLPGADKDQLDKYRRLLGQGKGEQSKPVSGEGKHTDVELQEAERQGKIMDDLDQQYSHSRMTTHFNRGLGLGYAGTMYQPLN